MANPAAQRKAQNKGVKHGTVRIGAKGKTVRRYNSKTGRWDVTKKDVRATGVPLRPTKSSLKPTNPPSSLTKTRQQTTTNRAAVKQGTEGPKVSRPSNQRRAILNPPWTEKKTSAYSNKVTLNKPSDFRKNARLQLVKQRSKDSRGRDVYRWVEVKSK